MNKKEYLGRIGIEKTDLAANLENLRFLQRQHLLNVPFENLDIHWKRPIVLDTEKFYQKIVKENRGGFCYELNGLFYELLNEIGFQSKILSARVTKGNGQFGPEKDHLSILTLIGDEEYLVDVGFGSFISEPLKFVLDVEQEDATGRYLIKKRDENYFDGRKTLTKDKFIETKSGEKIEKAVNSENEFNKILEREFQTKSNF